MAKERTYIKTPMFRGSFVYLIKARSQERDDGSTSEKFSIFIPLPKAAASTKQCIKELLAAVQAASAEKHGTALTPKQLKSFPIKDGDDMENDQFHGHWCINAAANFKPNVVDINGEELLTENEVYSGAWYKVMLSVWAWTSKKGGKGVSINVHSAVKLKDDDKFGGGSKAADDFADDIKQGGGKSDDLGDDLGI